MQVQNTTINRDGYPDRLKQLSNPPNILRFLGKDIASHFDRPVLAVVGSRKATAYGRAVTEDLSTAAARNGVCIVSGLALGIDSIAHRAAIDSAGCTIAVLPSGLKSIYPASHRGLAQNILKSEGTLVSEFADEFIPRRESFIQRNRIIAALSDALLVTEAAERSGSLYTARFALEIGKPVLAVPGNINSPNSSGTNNLIKAGATPVTSAQDIFDALNFTPDKAQKTKKILGDNENETIIIELLSDGVTSGDELHDKSGLKVEQYQQTLTILEIKGQISPLGNNHWKLNF